VGLTGSEEKVRLAREEFGYHGAINYKTADLASALKAACPEGIDAYFDNVGGGIADTVFENMNARGRIAQVGTASVASWDPVPVGPRRERQVLVKELRHQGFVIFNHEHRFEQALQALAAMIQRGQLRYREEIYEGLEQAPLALEKLYAGDNLGKTLIKLVE
jgi:NADPH-dependent curcumin reductase CurA